MRYRYTLIVENNEGRTIGTSNRLGVMLILATVIIVFFCTIVVVSVQTGCLYALDRKLGPCRPIGIVGIRIVDFNVRSSNAITHIQPAYEVEEII